MEQNKSKMPMIKKGTGKRKCSRKGKQKHFLFYLVFISFSYLNLFYMFASFHFFLYLFFITKEISLFNFIFSLFLFFFFSRELSSRFLFFLFLF